MRFYAGMEITEEHYNYAKNFITGGTLSPICLKDLSIKAGAISVNLPLILIIYANYGIRAKIRDLLFDELNKIDDYFRSGKINKITDTTPYSKLLFCAIIEVCGGTAKFFELAKTMGVPYRLKVSCREFWNMGHKKDYLINLKKEILKRFKNYKYEDKENIMETKKIAINEAPVVMSEAKPLGGKYLMSGVEMQYVSREAFHCLQSPDGVIIRIAEKDFVNLQPVIVAAKPVGEKLKFQEAYEYISGDSKLCMIAKYAENGHVLKQIYKVQEKDLFSYVNGLWGRSGFRNQDLVLDWDIYEIDACIKANMIKER